MSDIIIPLSMSSDELIDLAAKHSSVFVLVSIYDRIADSYTSPSAFSNILLAKRFFADLCSKDNIISSHSDDFGLYLCGGFNIDTGELIQLKSLTSYVCSAASLVTVRKQD